MQSLYRACGVAALLLLASTASQAAPITKLGVMSVLGREVQLVIAAPTVGTRVDRNAKDSLKVGNEFENFILRTTVEGAGREGLGEALMLARPASGAMPWQRDGQAVLVTQALLDAARAAKLSHLVLIQPVRAEARLQMFRSVTGTGQLEGLGFYVDTALEVEHVDTGQRSAGFLAPYAYFDMYLVDVATLDLQAEHRARASTAVADIVRQGNDPWQALSTERKVEALKQLTRGEIDAALRQWSRAAAASAPAR
ncbi:MAG: hypothetical protein ACT6S0_07865 [Roseateles sp.]|uniref:hypothetical protein n=1 Tax=Roseateles sp. TaxID=1971397 RepID=UPI004035F009